jgi:RHS repeat-associated protein
VRNQDRPRTRRLTGNPSAAGTPAAARTNTYPSSVGVHRYYDPSTGQFLTIDPLVDQTEQQYAYVSGDPVNSADLSGDVGNLPACFSPKLTVAKLACRPPIFPSTNPSDQAVADNLDARATSTSGVVATGDGLRFTALFNSEGGKSRRNLMLDLLAKIGDFGRGALGSISRKAAEERAVTLYRAVGEDEAADISATGKYRIAGNSARSGKYFYPTAAQARAFVARGWASRVTSASFARAAVDSADPLTLLTEGEGYFIPEEFFPHGPVEFHGW